MKLEHVSYRNLNARQKENYNYQKVSAILADYGFVTTRLSDDWRGADFIALHIDGETILKVQLKGRLCLDKKYLGKMIYVCFPYKDNWFLYPHDEVVNALLKSENISRTESWLQQGEYHFPTIKPQTIEYLRQFQL